MTMASDDTKQGPASRIAELERRVGALEKKEVRPSHIERCPRCGAIAVLKYHDCGAATVHPPEKEVMSAGQSVNKPASPKGAGFCQHDLLLPDTTVVVFDTCRCYCYACDNKWDLAPPASPTGGEEQWICHSCGESNGPWKRYCQRCLSSALLQPKTAPAVDSQGCSTPSHEGAGASAAGAAPSKYHEVMGQAIKSQAKMLAKETAGAALAEAMEWLQERYAKLHGPSLVKTRIEVLLTNIGRLEQSCEDLRLCWDKNAAENVRLRATVAADVKCCNEAMQDRDRFKLECERLTIHNNGLFKDTQTASKTAHECMDKSDQLEKEVARLLALCGTYGERIGRQEKSYDALLARDTDNLKRLTGTQAELRRITLIKDDAQTEVLKVHGKMRVLAESLEFVGRQLNTMEAALAAADRVCHELLYTEHSESLARYWAARGGHCKCTVCTPQEAPK